MVTGNGGVGVGGCDAVPNAFLFGELRGTRRRPELAVDFFRGGGGCGCGSSGS